MTLGPEYDYPMQMRLGAALRRVRGRRLWRSRALAGSQELEIAWYLVRWRLVRIEAETYRGVTLHGPRRVLEQLASAVRAGASVAAT